MRLVLASESPRRSELLRNAGFEFTVRPANVDESVRPGEDPAKYVQRLAWDKAVAAGPGEGETALGADTAVVIGGEILGKPSDPDDAVRMLRLLAGRKHEVITGICLRAGARAVTDWAVTLVWMTPMCDVEIAEYVVSGEPMGKAGAYAIQGRAARYIEKIEGSYSNVVGLPIALVYRYWREFGG
ncbi:MAG: maf protein [Bryobacterales bacterium]|nr:maf protein [Bryobacterales bacterium]